MSEEIAIEDFAKDSVSRSKVELCFVNRRDYIYIVRKDIFKIDNGTLWIVIVLLGNKKASI